MIDIQIPKDKSIATNSAAIRVSGGKKYKATTEAVAFTGGKYSAYFSIIFLDTNGKEIIRRIRWLSDSTNKPIKYTLIAEAPKDAETAVLAYRVNTEGTLRFDNVLKLRNVNSLILSEAESEGETYDELDDYLKTDNKGIRIEEFVPLTEESIKYNCMKSDAHKLIEELNTRGGRYHKITFPDGTVLNGIYDMKKHLEYYKIPSNLQGKTILDVGTSDGYFALELYKRGAEKVVAIDFNTGPFHQAVNELMGTNVEFVPKDLFDLDESFGKFDLVLCSHVLQHVSDLFTAIRKLMSVTREMAIITTAYLDNFPQFEDFPILYFLGDEKPGRYGGTYWTFHRANRKCLRKMMEVAKFKKVEEISTYLLVSEDGQYKIPSVVFHCWV